MELHRDLGSLRDFPDKLRNTIASLYYEYWWFQTTQDRSTGHPSWSDHVLTRMGLYETVPSLVTLMRKTRDENKLAFEMMLGTTSDLLRYNLKDVTRKSAVRRTMEKAFKEPFYEVPHIYSHIEKEFVPSRTRDSSYSHHTDATPDRAERTRQGSSQPNIVFIGQLPDPEHSRCEKTLQHGRFFIKYYKNPKSYGEVVAGISPLFNYLQVAVVEEYHEPIFIVRTEQGLQGTTYLCTLSRENEHKNLGEFTRADAENFLTRVFEEVSSLNARNKNGSSEETTKRVIIRCPSCAAALRVPKGKSGNVRCTVCPLCQHR